MLWIPSCKYKASWLTATSAEFNIHPAYTPSHFLWLLCKELWVFRKCSINKCIVRVTLRSGYSNNSLYFQKREIAADHIIGELSTPSVPSGYFHSGTLLTFLPLPTRGVLKYTRWEQFDPLHSPQCNANTLDLRGAGRFEQYDNCSSQPTESLAGFFFLFSSRTMSNKTRKVPTSIQKGMCQTTRGVPASNSILAEYYSCLCLLIKKTALFHILWKHHDKAKSNTIITLFLFSLNQTTLAGITVFAYMEGRSLYRLISNWISQQCLRPHMLRCHSTS